MSTISRSIMQTYLKKRYFEFIRVCETIKLILYFIRVILNSISGTITKMQLPTLNKS